MNAWHAQRKLYIEIMHPDSDEQVSLHLSRHLPRRLPFGKAIIITDRPRVLLAVIGKRWAALVRDLEREYSRTLDPTKRMHLKREIDRMRSATFAGSLQQNSDAWVTTWEQVAASKRNCFTLYITIPLDQQALIVASAFVATGGLLVQYELPHKDT